jgi:hypothetical protein
MALLKNHRFADLFPMMTDAELEALAEDIRDNGLRHAIVLYQGKILDGRNRYLACQIVGVEPRFEEYDGDDAGALALVISMNVRRRSLTAGQRAAVAAEAMEHLPERRGGDRRSKAAGSGNQTGGTHQFVPWTRDAVAEAFQVGAQSVQQARALKEKAPELFARIKDATAVLKDAYAELQVRLKEEAQREKDKKRIAKYQDAVAAGEMKFEDALQKVMDEEREAKQQESIDADSRQRWLTGFAEALDWFERFVDENWSAEELAWYVLPDSPGSFDHGITPERIAGVVRRMRLAQSTFQGVQDGRAKQGGAPRGPKAARGVSNREG